MKTQFFERRKLNPPYEYPRRHWGVDDQGSPTQQIVSNRRRAEFITLISKPRKCKRAVEQSASLFDEGKGLSTEQQQYDNTTIINAVRQEVDKWRILTNPNDWRLTPQAACLLQYWRRHHVNSIRLFFCDASYHLINPSQHGKGH